MRLIIKAELTAYPKTTQNKFNYSLTNQLMEFSPFSVAAEKDTRV